MDFSWSDKLTIVQNNVLIFNQFTYWPQMFNDIQKIPLICLSPRGNDIIYLQSL